MNKPVAWINKDESGLSFKNHGGGWEPPYTHPIKEQLTDEEIHQAIRRGFARDGFLSDGIFLEIKELLRKAGA